MATFQPITETSYLTAQNASQYRRIMRIFYYEYEKMHFQLYKEDVLALLRAYPGFEDYSMEQLKADLDSLEEWKNLTALQDPRKVYTIADYKNKQYRYSMSDAAVEIERLTVKLENLFMEGGGLSTNLFVRIHTALGQAASITDSPLKEINAWWHTLQEDFKRLNQNYQDYLREFYSGKNDKVLKSLEFVQHKDLFITYLRDFISELQVNAVLIADSLREARPSVEQGLLDKVIQSELAIPHPNVLERQYREIHIHDTVYGQWQALQNWFLPASGASECERVLDITNEIIRHIIQNAALLVQLQNWGLSRKDDYVRFIKMFLDCPDMDAAHKLSAHVFGIQQVQHYRVNGDRSTDSINISPYEEEPLTYVFEPRIRNYKPRLDRTGFVSHAWEKQKQREQYLQKVEQDRRLMLQYIQGKRLVISAITDCVSAAVRMTLLRWISQANTTESRSGRTEFGQVYHLEQEPGDCVLHCEDGDLTMPAYIFVFEEDHHV